MKPSICFFILSFGTLFSFRGTSIAGSDTPIHGLSIGYCQDLTLPVLGARAGIERYLFRNEKYAVIGGVSISARKKPDVYSSGELLLSNSFRRTFNFGLYLEQSIRGGYQACYYDFEFYDVNSDGDLVNMGRTWTHHFIGGYSIGAGYDFTKKTPLNLLFFIKPTLYLKIPNQENYFVFHNYGIETGFVIYPAWLQSKNNRSTDGSTQ